MSEANEKPSVTWTSESDPDPWHADSSLPASEQLSGISVKTDLPTELPEPAEEAEDDDDEMEHVEEAEDPHVPLSDETRRRSKTIARKQMLRERRRMISQGTLPEILEYERPQHRSQ